MSKITLTVTGRLVGGSLYEPNTTDMDGKQMTYKNGADAGKPRVDYVFRLAIKKGAEGHWGHTEWGKQLWALGAAAHPAVYQMPDYRWKIADGDSQVPNMKSKPPGKRPCDYEGYAGHWILKFAGGYAPKVYRAEGSAYVQVMEKDYAKLGHFVDVNFDAEGNGASKSPGLYLNHRMVCWRAFGPEITFGPTPDQAGFGTSALPPGATAAPQGSAIPPPVTAAAPAAPGAPAAPPASPPAPAARQMTAKAGGLAYEAFTAQGWTDDALIRDGYMVAGAPPAPLAPPGNGSVPLGAPAGAPAAPAGAPSGIPVVPNQQFMQVPGSAAPAAPAAPPASPPPPAGKQMTATATTTYAAYVAAGWSDAQLVQAGLMLA